MSAKSDQVRASYDEVASEYAVRIAGELEGKPLDRALLDVFAARVGANAAVCDAGCGPGHVARYLRDRGVKVYGIDLSPAMVAEAARLYPDVPFRVGDLADLHAEEELAGVVAFYSLIHLPRESVTPALVRMRERLSPDGLVFAAFHLGSDVVHLDEWWGKTVSVDFTFFELEEMRAYFTAAGFELEWVLERAPYEGVEHPSRRGYVLGRKPQPTAGP